MGDRSVKHNKCKPMVTIIFPSRGRPKKATATAMEWVAKCGLPLSEIELIFSLDSDDPELWNYPRQFPLENFSVFINPNRSAIDAINEVAEFYFDHRGKGDNRENFLIVISDDFECHEGWGWSLKNINTAIGKKDWILKTQDGIQDWVITLPIMDWAYYNRFGYVYHPSYKHGWADTELTLVAELTNRIIVTAVKFKHNHYSIGATKDKIYERSDAWFEEGRNNFLQRGKDLFGLSKEEVRGTMTPNVYSEMVSTAVEHL